MDSQRKAGRRMVEKGVVALNGKTSQMAPVKNAAKTSLEVANKRPIQVKKGGKVSCYAEGGSVMKPPKGLKSKKPKAPMPSAPGAPRGRNPFVPGGANQMAKFAAGGVAKIRHKQSSPSGAPKKIGKSSLI